MNNLSIVPGMSNLAGASQPAKNKAESQGSSTFLQAASASFTQLTAAQTFIVPGSHGGQPAKFWKEKLAVEGETPTIEEEIEERVADLLGKLKKLFRE